MTSSKILQNFQLTILSVNEIIRIANCAHIVILLHSNRADYAFRPKVCHYVELIIISDLLYLFVCVDV